MQYQKQTNRTPGQEDKVGTEIMTYAIENQEALYNALYTYNADPCIADTEEAMSELWDAISAEDVVETVMEAGNADREEWETLCAQLDIAPDACSRIYSYRTSSAPVCHLCLSEDY